MSDKLSDIASIITENYLKDAPDATFINCVYTIDYNTPSNYNWSYDFFYNQRGKKIKKAIDVMICNQQIPKHPI